MLASLVTFGECQRTLNLHWDLIYSASAMIQCFVLFNRMFLSREASRRLFHIGLYYWLMLVFVARMCHAQGLSPLCGCSYAAVGFTTTPAGSAVCIFQSAGFLRAAALASLTAATLT